MSLGTLRARRSRSAVGSRARVASSGRFAIIGPVRTDDELATEQRSSSRAAGARTVGSAQGSAGLPGRARLADEDLPVPDTPRVDDLGTTRR